MLRLYLRPSMKTRFLQFLMVILTVVLLGQMIASAYVSVKTICNMETPFEEAADEDTDNEGELDKVFEKINIENTELSYSITHHTIFESNPSSQIKEIVPPPPKA
jgi:hypothetical protein